jgi:hypothetical protein
MNLFGLTRVLDDKYLTVAEVAKLFKLNQQTVRNWIDGLCGIGLVVECAAFAVWHWEFG